MREEFTTNIKRKVAERSCFICNNPDCHCRTIGPHSDEDKSLSDGIVAHISAASEGGPRYDPSQTQLERGNNKNAILLCHNCSDLVDKDPKRYTKELLLEWKNSHEELLRSWKNEVTQVQGHVGDIEKQERPFLIFKIMMRNKHNERLYIFCRNITNIIATDLYINFMGEYFRNMMGTEGQMSIQALQKDDGWNILIFFKQEYSDAVSKSKIQVVYKGINGGEYSQEIPLNNIERSLYEYWQNL